MQLPFFVYGTLKRGEPNYPRYLAGYTISEEPANLPHAALYTAGPYPFLVQTPDLVAPGDIAYGQIVVVRPHDYNSVIAGLDNLEGYVANGANNLYERIVVTVETNLGRQEAYVYVAGAETVRAIRVGELWKVAGGNWRGG
ncbi:MAG: gamma-glutamylcyclotransferase [Oscillochloris sp.]|nr:gamma-glutamylcyclotransferase [Oscillochloris sp.]